MRRLFDRIVDEILLSEGGYVDHPSDPGGATNLGITIGTLKRLGLDLDGDGDIDKNDVRKVSRDVAAGIFRQHYWDPVRGDELPAGVDYTLSDASFHHGPRGAIKLLQGVLGVPVDGFFGPITMGALKKASPLSVIHYFARARQAYLESRAHAPAFIRGWTARVTKVQNLSAEMAEEKAPTRIQRTFWDVVIHVLELLLRKVRA